MINKVTLVGHVGQPPEQVSDNERAPVRFSLATNERYKNEHGDYDTITEWHNVLVWGKMRDTVLKHVFKGQLLYIEGKIETKKYEKDGITRYNTSVIMRELKMLSWKDDKKDDPSIHASGNRAQENPTYGKSAPVQSSDEEIRVEDIPF